jgi:hypothetical protein
MTPTPRRTASRKEEVENPPSTPEPNPPAHNDFLPFVWQKLNDLDGRFADFCEKYGQVDARMESIDKRVESISEMLKETESKLSERIKETESKLSGVRDDVRSAKVWITAIIAIVAALVGLYKLIGPHIAWL